MNLNKIQISILIISFFLVSVANGAASLLAEIYDNGAIVIKNGNDTVAMIEGHFSFPGFKNPTFFKTGQTLDGSHLGGLAVNLNGTKVILRGAAEEVKDGLKINYEMIPAESFQVQVVDAYIRLVEDDWKGADFQMGLDSYKVTPQIIGAFKSRQQCLILLGPSAVHKDLFLEVIGNEKLGAAMSDNRKIGQPVLAFRLESDKALNKSQLWKKGEMKSFEFTVLFNRPLKLVPGIHSQIEYEQVKSKMIAKPVVVSSPPIPLPTITLAMGSGQMSTYPLPDDAKSVAFHVSRSAGYHVFVPVEFNVKNKLIRGSMFWDTGITDSTGDLQCTKEFFNRLDLKIIKNHHLRESAVNSSQGSYTTQEVNDIVVSNDKESDAGPTDIQVKFGEMTLSNRSIYTNQTFEDIIKGSFDPNDVFFKLNPLIGAVPYRLLKNFLISMDYKNQMIYFRPLDTKQRTFFNRKPLAQLECLATDWGIYCPYSINKKVMGYAHFDTGSPRNLVDTSELNVSDLPITSYVVGGHDTFRQGLRYLPLLFKGLGYVDAKGEKKLKVTSFIGNDYFKDEFITIDPENEKIYVEEIP